MLSLPVAFSAEGQQKAFEEKMETLYSWADEDRVRYFSGVATYTKSVHLTAAELAGKVWLDFGQGTVVVANPSVKSGMRALLDGPIRDAAVVTVNGKRVGSVWHPPYALDITGELHEGENRTEIQVANTAVNMLAGRAPTDYHLLNARYGERVTPMNAEDIKVLPSGILGTIHLMGTK